MDDIAIPICPRCGDPVTSGCYPADGICGVDDDCLYCGDPACRGDCDDDDESGGAP